MDLELQPQSSWNNDNFESEIKWAMTFLKEN